MPALGRYDSRDRRVMRKHAEWLTDAGVDFIWLDWSNNVTYDPDEFWVGGKQDLIEDATAILFDEYYKMGKVGMKHPKISIFIGVTGAPEAADDGRLQKKADQVYDMYANNPKYKDMMQLYLVSRCWWCMSIRRRRGRTEPRSGTTTVSRYAG